MNSNEAAWLAGLFEGEGCISQRNSHSVRINISMTDADVVERCKSLTGVGWMSTPYTKGAYKTMYVWNVDRAVDVDMVLRLLIPWFGTRRRERAEWALQRLAGGRSL